MSDGSRSTILHLFAYQDSNEHALDSHSSELDVVMFMEGFDDVAVSVESITGHWHRMLAAQKMLRVGARAPWKRSFEGNQVYTMSFHSNSSYMLVDGSCDADFVAEFFKIEVEI
jgi:hypothetical protein